MNHICRTCGRELNVESEFNEKDKRTICVSKEMGPDIFNFNFWEDVSWNYIAGE
jgi:hypothetical protein